jgi:hypothetical protein
LCFSFPYSSLCKYYHFNRILYNFPVHIQPRFTLAPPRNTSKTCHTTTKPLTWNSTYQEYIPCVMHIMQILYRCCWSNISV